MTHNLKPILSGVTAALALFVLAGHVKKVNFVNRSIAFDTNEKPTKSDVGVALPMPTKPLQNTVSIAFEDLTENIASKKGTFSIFIHNLTTAEVATINPDEIYYGASLYKLPIALAVLHEIYTGKLSPDTLVTYTKDDFSDGSGSIPRDNYGAAYTVEDLISRLMKDSDNSAQIMLTRTVAKSSLTEAFAIVTPDNNPKLYELNEGTAGDYAYAYNYLFLTALNRNEDTFIGQKNALYLLGIMKGTSFEDRISTGLSTSDFSHKIGNWGDTGSWHDCGLVYTKELHIVCLMSKNTTFEDVADVGKLIGEFIEN